MLGGDIPTEVLENIFSWIKDDFDALRTCSLVGRNLTAPSQRYLLASITLRPLYMEEHLEQLPTKAAQLLNLIKGAPYVASYVQRLTLVDGQSAPFKGEGTKYTLFWVAEEPSLGPLLDVLVSLRGIKINAPRVYWSRIPAINQAAFEQILSRITLEHLEINFHKYPSPLLVKSTTQLKTLILRGQCDTEDLILVPPDKRRPVLRSLVVDDLSLDFSYNIEWLMNPGCAVDLSKLKQLAIRIHGSMRRNKPAMQLVHFTKETLDTLVLTPCDEVNKATPQIITALATDPMILNGLNHLRHLSLHLTFSLKRSEQGQWVGATPWNFILRFFSPLTSPHRLEEISINLDCTDYYNTPEQNRWGELDEALNSPFLAELKFVRMHVVCLPRHAGADSWLTKMMERVETAMPFLYSCAVLRFTHEASLIQPIPAQSENWFARHP